MSVKRVNGSSGFVPIKSKFEADILRFSICTQSRISYEDFKQMLTQRHGFGTEFYFFIWYSDPADGDMLPINNDKNFEKALLVGHKLLRIFLQRKGDKFEDMQVYGTLTKKGRCNVMGQSLISKPLDFRQVSSIIDTDILPKTCRRVRLLKRKTDKPLGFYIRDGPSFRQLPLSVGGGIEKVSGIFISRIVPGGLAESTGLLAPGDEVLEVNGIEVTGKSLDQVTDMMIANITNLIITVKPSNNTDTLKSNCSSLSHVSQRSQSLSRSNCSIPCFNDDEDEDRIKVYHV